MSKVEQRNKKEVIKLIEETISRAVKQDGFEIKKIWLFGSRARGDASSDSDWDILVLLDKTCNFKTRQKLASRIRVRLARFNVPVDVIIKSEQAIEIQKNDVGYLAYYAIKEGIEI